MKTEKVFSIVEKNEMMLQKLFKKLAAVKIAIPRKGFKTNKSLSPDMMQEAFAATANSINLFL